MCCQQHMVGSCSSLVTQLITSEISNIPEDVNFGISGQVVTNFLNVPIKTNINKYGNYDASQIYEYMRPSVVFIVSQ